MDNSGNFVAPDGGVRAWMVMTASFLINGILFGVINSYSVFNLVFLADLQSKGETNAQSKAALVGALAIATTFFLSSVSGVLTNFMGIRLTAVIGGLFASGAMLLSSFAEYNLDILCFTYGIMYGLGAALCYTPSLAILCHYFSKHLGFVNGIVTSGSSIFTIFMPALLESMISATDIASTFRLLALIMSVIVFASLLFKPIRPIEKVQYTDSFKTIVMKNVINVEIWSKKSYIIWAFSVAIACTGYFVPYVHMGAFVAKQFPGSNTNLPIQCIGVTSLLGRISFGFIADRPKMNRIMLQQIAFASIGLLTITLPFISSFPVLCAATLGMGLFDGAFISLLGPIAFDLLGPKNAGHGIGCLLGMASLPMSFGPPFAAFLNTKMNSFTVPFVLAGISPILGSMLLCSMRCISKPTEDDEEASLVRSGATVSSRRRTYSFADSSGPSHLIDPAKLPTNGDCWANASDLCRVSGATGRPVTLTAALARADHSHDSATISAREETESSG